MENMSSRERILAVLSGQLPDRVPVSPFVQDEYLSYTYPEKKQVHRVFDAVELSRALKFDLIAKPRDFEEPHFLKTASPEEVADRTRSVMETGKPGGHYIFSTSDFLEKGTPLENVKAMIDAATGSGWY